MTMREHPCAECVNRRQFLAAAATASAALVAAACGDGDISGVARIIPLPTGPVTIKVGDHPGLANVGVIVKVDAIGVKRTAASTFEAMSLLCTHQSCPVTITSNTQLDCPCHFSRFDGNGAVLRGPAKEPLPRFNTSYNSATDVLTIG